MDQKRRMIAWMLSIAMLLGPFAACAEEAATPSEASGNVQASAGATQEAAPELNTESDQIPTDTPTQEPAGDPADAPTQEPAGDPTDTPTQEPAGDPTDASTQEPAGSPTDTPTQEPAGDPTDAPTQEPAGDPADTPTQEPAGSPTDTPTQEPTGDPADTPTEEPEQPEEDFSPKGEAWAQLDDGTLVDGTLQSILNRIKENGQGASIFILTREAVTISGIELDLLDRVTMDPAEETFGEKAALYEIVVTVGKAAEGEIPKWTVQAVRKDAEQKPTDEPTDEPTGEPTDKPTGEPTDEPTDEPTTEPTDKPTGEPTDEPTGEPTDEPTGEPTDKPTGEPTDEPTGEPTDEPTGEPTDEPTAEPTDEPTTEPTDEPTPGPSQAPAVALTVEAEGYHEGEWSSEIPTFTLSGIEKGNREYVYGVFVCNERLILLENDAETYTPAEQGEINLRFAILDMMGDIVALSEQYDMLLDSTPPSSPMLEQVDSADTAAWIYTFDGESGIEAISYDFGETWEAYDEGFEPYSIIGAKGEVVAPGRIVVRDHAGNTAANEMEFEFGLKVNGLLPSGGGSGGGKPKIKHVKETMDYSRADYNAMELKFPEKPVSELVAGGTELPLALTGEEGAEAGLFTAKLDTWRSSEDDTPEGPNALVLSAENSEGMNTWSFTGDAYKLLYNSGIDYLVMTSGEYMAAIPTAGFTGGTQYAKLKASGVSTRKFAYTVCQDEALRETTMSVTVEGETYLLGEERDQPMYRYDVLVGTKDMMRRPYESYMPQGAAAAAK